LGEYALSVAGEYDPSVPAQSNAEDTPQERARRVMQDHWRTRAEWKPDGWALDLFAFEDGRPVGQQRITADHFAVLGEVRTGSVVRPGRRGAGIGTAMRAAVLHLAFEELGAQYATTGAKRDNRASIGVSDKFGYEPNGERRFFMFGVALNAVFFQLSAERWRDHAPPFDIKVTGLDGHRALFGVDG
jgi:RimJ/RimL family protein N-acetyltransferase